MGHEQITIHIPKVRFPNFNEAWTNKPLNKVTDYADYRGKTPSKKTCGIQLVTAKNIKKGFIDYLCSEEYISPSDYGEVMRRGLPEKGDVLFTTEAPMGNVAQIDNPHVALAQRVIKFRGRPCLDSTFLKYSLLSPYFQQLLKKKAIGSTVLGIQGKVLHKLHIAFPSLPEQEKIASFLSDVDAKIDNLTQQKACMQQYKKGCMQKLFSQEIRFKDDDGNTFPAWEEKTIGDVLVESKIKGSTGDNAQKLTVKLWRKGVYAKEEIRAGSENTQYYVRKKNQFIYSKLDFLNCAFGIIPDELDGFESTVDLPCFDISPLVSPKFLLERVSQKNFYKKYGDKADGSRKAKRIHAATFFEMPIQLPSLPEQTRIVNFLTNLDSKLEALGKQLEAMKEFKKGLLQGMFA